MANYFVGDVQGCYRELMALLQSANFNRQHDHLYLAGDLVARGEDSLSVLRFLYDLGEHAHPVLGNHDLHLLAVSEGFMPLKAKDRTQPILDAPDADKLLIWLRHQPLLISRRTTKQSKGFVMTHAGIPPAWDLDTAKSCAKKVESMLQSKNYRWLLQNMYDNEPSLWSAELTSIERYRYTINALTRMRFCHPNGALDMACKLPPEEITNENLHPWFEIPNRKKIEESVIFGHWAALEGKFDSNLYGLDTGCVWGGKLTMLRWSDKHIFQI